VVISVVTLEESRIRVILTQECYDGFLLDSCVNNDDSFDALSAFPSSWVDRDQFDSLTSMLTKWSERYVSSFGGELESRLAGLLVPSGGCGDGDDGGK